MIQVFQVLLILCFRGAWFRCSCSRWYRCSKCSWCLCFRDAWFRCSRSRWYMCSKCSGAHVPGACDLCARALDDICAPSAPGARATGAPALGARAPCVPCASGDPVAVLKEVVLNWRTKSFVVFFSNVFKNTQENNEVKPKSHVFHVLLGILLQSSKKWS